MNTAFYLKKVCFTGCLSVIFTSILAAQPRINFDNDYTFNFGTARQEQVVEHTFKFTNVGDDTLIIKSVKSSCGCTGALMSNKNIPPGESGELAATFNIGRRKGHQKKTITVRTNDPTNYAVKFALVGDIFTPIDINPIHLMFRSLETGKTDTARVRIRNNTDKTLQLGKPACTIEDLRLIMPENKISPRESIVLTGTYKPVNSAGRLIGVVTLPVVQGDEPDVTIRVFGYIKQQ